MARLRDLDLGRGRIFPVRLLSVRYSRSGGPGGQHVNKVATKVDLRADLTAAAALLGVSAVDRLRERLASRLDGDGQVQIISGEHRDQIDNLEAALARMEALLRGALVEPKRRRRTRPTKSSKERRLQSKRERGEIKKGRSSPSGE